MTTTQTQKRTGTLEPVKDAQGRVRYYRGKLRLSDGSRARIDIPEAKRTDEDASRAFVERAQAEEDRTHVIFNARTRVAANTAESTMLPTASWTIGAYKRHFFKQRRASGRVEDVDTEEGRLKHLAPLDDVEIGALTTPAYRAAIIHMRDNARKEDGSPHAPRTIIHVHRTFKLVMTTAVAEGVIAVNPCTLLPGDLPAKRDKDPKWRKTARFSREELLAIIFDERIPEDRRAFYAVMFLGSTRFGEAAALRWSDYDEAKRPLGMLTIDKSYSTKKRAEKDTKTEVPREMPVHPILASVLATWKALGFPALFGRAPKPDDLIVPSREGRNRNANHMLRRFHQDSERIGQRARRQHDTRRTFISLAREGGASDLLKWATHGPGTEITDLYTTPDWRKLCAEVLCVKLDPEPTKDEGTEAVTASIPSAVQVDRVPVHFLRNPEIIGDSWRGGRDSNPRPPA